MCIYIYIYIFFFFSSSALPGSLRSALLGMKFKMCNQQPALRSAQRHPSKGGTFFTGLHKCLHTVFSISNFSLAR